jgi:hypothetical protein
MNSSQTVMSSGVSSSKSTEEPLPNWSQSVTSSKRHRGLAYRPYAFTEQGVAMLSSVLRSKQAVQVNITIMRTFVQLRQWMSTHPDLAEKLKSLESKYDRQFKVVFDALRELMREKKTPKKEIGFHTAMPKPGKVNGAQVRSRKS